MGADEVAVAHDDLLSSCIFPAGGVIIVRGVGLYTTGGVQEISSYYP